MSYVRPDSLTVIINMHISDNRKRLLIFFNHFEKIIKSDKMQIVIVLVRMMKWKIK